MTLKHYPDVTQLKYLSTHPGAPGAGQSMIESAVRESDAHDHHGKLELEALPGQAENFYRSLGFEGDHEKMTLDPSESNLWTKEGNDWSFDKIKGKSYGTLLGRKEASTPQAAQLKRPLEGVEFSSEEQGPASKRGRV